MGASLIDLINNNILIEHNAKLIQEQSSITQRNVEALEANSAAITSNAKDIRRNAEGVAIAMAMSAPSVRIDQRFSVSMGYGNLRESNAPAVSNSFRIGEKILLSVGGGVGLDNWVGGGKAILTVAR